MLFKLGIVLKEITYQYSQFHHVTLWSSFINNPITAVKILLNSYNILNINEVS